MPASFLIIVNGLPVSGKSTIAQKISLALRIPVVAKDALKEVLFDHLGSAAPECSQAFGAASMELLYRCVEEHLRVGASVIADANFRPSLARPRFQWLIDRYGSVPVEVRCDADGVELLRRFKSRVDSGERHPGHDDHLSFQKWENVFLSEPREWLDLGDGAHIDVDTTDFGQVDLEEIVRQVKRSLLVDIYGARSIRGLHHAQITIPTGEEARARAFYCGVLGLTEIDKPDSLAGRPGFWLQVGDRQVHVGTESDFDRTVTKAHLAYEVTGLDEWRRRLSEEGIEILDGIPIPGYERFEFRDPFRNRVEMIEPVDQSSFAD